MNEKCKAGKEDAGVLCLASLWRDGPSACKRQTKEDCEETDQRMIHQLIASRREAVEQSDHGVFPTFEFYKRMRHTVDDITIKYVEAFKKFRSAALSAWLLVSLLPTHFKSS